MHYCRFKKIHVVFVDSTFGFNVSNIIVLRSSRYKTRAASEQGVVVRPGEGVVIAVEDSCPGYVAATIKASDQMTGQTFNDVGRIDEEGLIKLDRTDKDRHGKM